MSHLVSGMELGRRNMLRQPREKERCDGKVRRVVITNCEAVMRVPDEDDADTRDSRV